MLKDPVITIGFGPHASVPFVVTFGFGVFGVAPVAPVAAFSANPTFGNVPLFVQFTDSSTNTPTSWAWNFGDGGTSTLQNPTHTYSVPGEYTVSLTATNAGGSNTLTKPNYITVVKVPQPDDDGGSDGAGSGRHKGVWEKASRGKTNKANAPKSTPEKSKAAIAAENERGRKHAERERRRQIDIAVAVAMMQDRL